MDRLSVLALQMDIVWQDPKANRQHIESLLKGAPPTDVIIFPEMFTSGFSKYPSNGEEPGGETALWMQKIAGEHDALVMGSYNVREKGKSYNRLLVVTKTGIVGQYDKRHLFRMAGEDERYSGGNTRTIIEYKGWRICPLVCYDLRFPVWSRNTMGEDGRMDYDLLIYVANWPRARAYHWDSLLIARAIENQAFVVGINRVGVDGNDISYNGCSSILDPLGNRLAHSTEQESLLFAQLDKNVQEKLRKSFPVWMDADQFTIL